MTTSTDKPKKFFTVEEFASRDDIPFSLSAMRYLLYKRKENGLTSATIKIGKRVYIDYDSFLIWLESKKEEDS